MRVVRYPKLSINVTDEGLKIWSGHKSGIYLFFKNDGTFDRNKRDYKIHSEPVHIQKHCPTHILKEGPITVIKGNPPYIRARDTTLDNLRELACQYEFFLFGDSEGNYVTSLHSEFLHYNTSEAFWHLNTWFGSDATRVYYGEFYQKINEMLRLKLPATNAKNIQSAEQLISKIKMYTLFS
jgi:hypothetical protein